jgi:hypothetical protein
MSQVVTCAVMRKAGLKMKWCCGSCHDDADEGYSYLCSLSGLPEDMNGEEQVCCSNAREVTPEEVEMLRAYFAKRGNQCRP